MRPVKCRSLPIFLLHDVFAQYLSLSKKPLPATDPARIALHVAKALCNTMGDYFDNEIIRRDAFLQAIEPLFSRWMTAKEVTSQGTAVSTRTDATISEKGITMVQTEIKNGKNSGDAYMQASRGYEVYTVTLQGKHPTFLSCGAPTFICCLNGQSKATLNRKYITNIIHADEELRIAGAFKDGMQVVVEPLSNNLLYPDSREDGRTVQLAQHLFALYSCLENLAEEIARYGTSNPSCYIFLYSPFFNLAQLYL
jgi:hypothetical protein